jgi:exopolysaccharide biosynthesis glucuronosyltransferase PssD
MGLGREQTPCPSAAERRRELESLLLSPADANALHDDESVTMKPRKILAVASGGGHWVQLMRLCPAFAGHRVAFVTVNPTYRCDVGDAPFHVVTDATRWNKLALAKAAMQLAWIVLRIRPHVVVSTGAAPGFLAILLGRAIGARTVWIDSIANVERLSLSGERIGRFADLWLTQWPHLVRPGGPSFEGSVL